MLRILIRQEYVSSSQFEKVSVTYSLLAWLERFAPPTVFLFTTGHFETLATGLIAVFPVTELCISYMESRYHGSCTVTNAVGMLLRSYCMVLLILLD